MHLIFPPQRVGEPSSLTFESFFWLDERPRSAPCAIVKCRLIFSSPRTSSHGLCVRTKSEERGAPIPCWHVCSVVTTCSRSTTSKFAMAASSGDHASPRQLPCEGQSARSRGGSAWRGLFNAHATSSGTPPKPESANRQPRCLRFGAQRANRMTATDSVDLDWRLRLAAFARLRALRERHGADIATAAELAEGFEFESERIRLSPPRQGIWKPRQADAALTIVTAPPHPGRPAPYDDHVDEASGFYSYRYERTDRQLASNRAVRRAMELHRPPLYLIGLDKGLYQVV